MFGKTSWVLKGIRGPHAHAVYVLDRSVSIGRSANADIQVLDQRVSRQHARLLVSHDEVILEDLGSHNGSHVHGHQVHRRPLRPGDKIQIGVAEYALDQIKGRVLTSAIFLNKLTTRETMGATAVKKRVAKEILTAETAEMPVQRVTQEITASVSDAPSERAQARPPQTVAEPTAPTEAEPEYLREQRARAIRLPTPAPGELGWSAKAPEPTAPAPSLDEPDAPVPLHDPVLDAVTLPLDPRTQRVHTPVPQSIEPIAPPAPEPEPEPAPAPPGEHDALQAALRTVDAVVHLLKLRSLESGGDMLRIQDRESLRRLEGVLRESRRSKANRRRWLRLPCELSAELGEGHDDARVTDIGAGGLRIDGRSVQVTPGDELMVRVRLGDDRLARVVVFQTRVAWVDSSNGTFGTIFAGPAQWELAG